MTSRERAQALVENYYAEMCWGYDPVTNHHLEVLIAKAIDDAVAEERDRITMRIIEDIRERKHK